MYWCGWKAQCLSASWREGGEDRYSVSGPIAEHYKLKVLYRQIGSHLRC